MSARCSVNQVFESHFELVSFRHQRMSDLAQRVRERDVREHPRALRLQLLRRLREHHADADVHGSVVQGHHSLWSVQLICYS